MLLGGSTHQSISARARAGAGAGAGWRAAVGRYRAAVMTVAAHCRPLSWKCRRVSCYCVNDRSGRPLSAAVVGFVRGGDRHFRPARPSTTSFGDRRITHKRFTGGVQRPTRQPPAPPAPPSKILEISSRRYRPLPCSLLHHSPRLWRRCQPPSALSAAVALRRPCRPLSSRHTTAADCHPSFRAHPPLGRNVTLPSPTIDMTVQTTRLTRWSN
jgi:hypothetical protein